MIIYLDSCMVMYLIEQRTPQYDLLVQQLQRAAQQQAQWVTSPLVRLECLVKPKKDANTEQILRYERYFSGVKKPPFAQCQWP